jgi:hypothetical protein
MEDMVMLRALIRASPEAKPWALPKSLPEACFTKQIMNHGHDSGFDSGFARNKALPEANLCPKHASNEARIMNWPHKNYHQKA